MAEAEQREALKNMTEAERRAWEAAHPKELAEAPKKKWRFLQKYWHKGAFFQARASGRTRPLHLRDEKKDISLPCWHAVHLAWPCVSRDRKK